MKECILKYFSAHLMDKIIKEEKISIYNFEVNDLSTEEGIKSIPEKFMLF